ncbi:ABC transporter, substrate-binding subunit [Candidatus Phytoplasma rubi]|uniref:ABC transporter, substrate-binding subunit n=1 Tax=Candidatus Phytoplasma rubi TaxID=399025 RepID=A0ABY7BR64_9MOLU|nr:hypothetical protein [Candidatus Phytoplasma rubi]WAN63210.1 ABC transporter, substrate-binding subunit [Candidatus Phytoplasma rubi]
MNKIQKFLYLKIGFILIIIVSIVGGWWFFINNKGKDTTKTLKIATALSNVKDFLTSDQIKNRLQEKGMELDVQFISNEYAQTHKLLMNNEVIAKLDSHLSYSIDENDKMQFSDSIIVAHPLYWPHIGLYNIKQPRKNKNKIKNWEDFEIIKKQESEPIKILICDNKAQINIMLRFLEKLKIISRKEISKDTEQKIKDKRYFLDKNDFDIPKNIEICIPSGVTLLNSVQLFKDSEYDLFINYPAIAGVTNGEIDVIKKYTKPEVNDFAITNTISLIIKEKYKNNELIKELKSILSIQDIIDFFQGKYKNGDFIPSNEIEKITNKINQYFS